ncbi:hypothetical protein [Phenylobacterium koreense]|uniref:Flagellar biosynthesis/type III secretory pathway M-ring protein FliF/YscJ n=1 Tax=Phenylobacterium koreense TaxID=266125 RepID=A0ABV2EJT2_9CAUL
MTPSEFRRLFSPAHWALVAAGLVACLAVIAALIWFATAPGRERARAAEARAEAQMSQARTSSAADAVESAGRQALAEDQIHRNTEASENAIRNAPASQRTGVALDELCMRKSARHDPQCAGRVFDYDAAGVAARSR